MENNNLDHNQAPAAAALRCPRCESANTKFCYYNNYSLSQPRHFCKACKRYWTRGGTLRNVPVGGGCRKNKRHHLKRPPSVPPPTPSATSQNPRGGRQLFQIADQMNPLFYGKQQSNPPPPSFDGQLGTSFASSGGFGYPSAAGTFFGGGASPANNDNNNNNNNNSAAVLSPTMATLLASTLNNKFFSSSSSSSNGVVTRPDSSSLDHRQHFQGTAALDGLQMSSGVKNQQQEWNFNGFTNGNNHHSGSHVAAVEGIGSDPHSAYWNALWHDPGSIGPSVTSLI